MCTIKQKQQKRFRIIECVQKTKTKHFCILKRVQLKQHKKIEKSDNNVLILSYFGTLQVPPPPQSRMSCQHILHRQTASYFKERSSSHDNSSDPGYFANSVSGAREIYCPCSLMHMDAQLSVEEYC